jgi:hypothetical protein
MLTKSTMKYVIEAIAVKSSCKSPDMHINATTELSRPCRKFKRYADIIWVDPGGTFRMTVHTRAQIANDAQT